MKKLITLFIAMVITVTCVAQKFNAVSLVSNEKLDLETEQLIEEVNIFNISMEDRVVVHNQIKTDGTCTSQIYRLQGYKDGEIDGEFTMIFFFESSLHDYELEVVSNDQGTFVIGANFIYQSKVYSLKTYK